MIAPVCAGIDTRPNQPTRSKRADRYPVLEQDDTDQTTEKADPDNRRRRNFGISDRQRWVPK